MRCVSFEETAAGVLHVDDALVFSKIFCMTCFEKRYAKDLASRCWHFS